jgi:N-acyl-D-aspartate/D-glutamate deacylase
VAPGFVNMMSWANESPIEDTRSQSDIRQGVTLEIMGEGSSMGPLNDAMKEQMVSLQSDIRYDVEWTTLAEYLEYLERRGISPNVASFIGAATPRQYVIGQQGGFEASLAPEGVFLKSNAHPRAYGSFARVLAKFVREEKVLTLEEAVRKLAALPAQTMKIDRRGELREGYYADVVVFDPDTIQDHATFVEPHQYATGKPYDPDCANQRCIPPLKHLEISLPASSPKAPSSCHSTPAPISSMPATS